MSFISQRHGVALQVVHRGRNFEDAEEGFFDLSESWFHLREDEREWYTPKEFDYRSAIANNYRFGCTIYQPSGFQVCNMAAQYGLYVTNFHTGMSPLMTYADLERILQTIDNNMKKCLDK